MWPVLKKSVKRLMFAALLAGTVLLGGCGDEDLRIYYYYSPSQPATGDWVWVAADIHGDNDLVAQEYQWDLAEKPDGSGATLSHDNHSHTSFTPDVAGHYRLNFQYKAKDIFLNHAYLVDRQGSVDITVTGDPLPVLPVADAGDDQSIITYTRIVLDGTGSSDPGGAQLTYAWSVTAQPQDSNPILESPTGPTTGFIPDKAGTYEVTLIVNNGENDSAPSTVTITVTNPQ